MERIMGDMERVTRLVSTAHDLGVSNARLACQDS